MGDAAVAPVAPGGGALLALLLGGSFSGFFTAVFIVSVSENFLKNFCEYCWLLFARKFVHFALFCSHFDAIFY